MEPRHARNQRPSPGRTMTARFAMVASVVLIIVLAVVLAVLKPWEQADPGG